MACAVLSSAPASGAEDLRGLPAKLRSSRPAARQEAVDLAARHPEAVSLADLSAAARTEANPDIRARAYIALGAKDPVAAVAPLADALKGDPSPLVRAVAAQTLSRIGGGPEVRKALVDGLSKDSDLDVRRSCATGLAFHASTDSVKALAEAADDRDPELRRRVGLALTRHPKGPERDRVLDRLERDADPEVSKRVKEMRREGGQAR